MSEDQIIAHTEAHLLAGENASYYTTYEQVPNTVHHEAVTHQETVPAVTHVVHHDAVTHVVHHDAQTHVVNHPREVRTEQKWVEG